MHISDIKHYERCEKYLWLCEHEPKAFQPFVYFNESMNDLIKEYFCLPETVFEGCVGDDPSRAIEALQTEEILMNARFAKDDLRIKIPLMIKQNEGWIVYFSYVSCYPKESEAQKLADTISVLEALDIPILDVEIIHLNANYIRGKELNVRELLVVTPYLYNKKNNANHTVLSLIEAVKRDVFSFLPKITNVLAGDCPKQEEGPACMKGGKCRYYEDCFPQKGPDTSILNLMQTSHKYDLLEQGYTDMKTIDVDLLEGTRQQYAQLMAARHHGFYMDHFAVADWIKHAIHYPISYLDFEWETYAYPPYQGMKPYDVLVFQYSLHIEEYKGAPLTHAQYIGEQDCRIAFIEHLLANIADHGTILVYNMEGAEKLRLKQLAVQFPQYEAQLHALCDRMVDLSLPFETGNIYDSRMKGFYSLKKLIEVFSDYDYQTLDISQGLEAAHSWRTLNEVDEEEAEVIRKALYKYCAMDTYAEYIMLHKIYEFLEDGDKHG